MPDPEHQDVIPEPIRRKSQKRLVGVAVSESVARSFFTGISPLFLLALGATPFQVGILETTSHLQRLSRLAGLKLVPRLGKAGLIFWARALTVPSTAGLVLLAYVGTPGTLAVGLALLALGLREFLRQAGNTVWWALIQDNAAGDALGAFIARMRVQQRGAEFLIPILAGWYLGATPASTRFTGLFAVGLAASFLAAVWSRGLAELSRPPTSDGTYRRLVIASRQPPIRWLCAFMGVYYLVNAATYPFWVVALTRQGMPAMVFVWMTSILALGQVISLHGWGRMVDRHASRPVLTLALGAKTLMGLSWLILPAHPGWLIAWAAVFYLLWGALEGGQHMGRTKAMMDVVPAEYQVEGFNLIMYAGSIGGIIGGLSGGTAFEWAIEQPPIGGFDFQLLYLAGIQLGFAAVWYLATRFEGHKDQISISSLMARTIHFKR